MTAEAREEPLDGGAILAWVLDGNCEMRLVSGPSRGGLRMLDMNEMNSTPDTESAAEFEAEFAAGSAGAVAEVIRALKEEAAGLGRVAAALGPLAHEANHGDLGKLEKAIGAAGKKLAELGAGDGAGERVLDEVKAARETRLEAIRERLGAELKEACQGAGLLMRIDSKEEPVRLRIPPFAVVIDRAKGEAGIEFAQLEVGSCAADAGAILRAHGDALAGMGAFESETFFGACLRAWRAAVATGAGGESGRVEISAFLPYLAMEMQPDAFRKDPSPLKFVAYPKVRFAFDVMRLQEARGFSQGGWRMNLGVATGITASSKNKSRVLWVENALGEGEYKLNVFFQKMEG